MSGGISATTLAVASAAMTVVGGVASAIGQGQQAAAQGQAAQMQAQMRQQQLDQQAQVSAIQAQQLRTQANTDMATSERQAIEAQRKGHILASKATAVMAASGGGVDENLVASLVGEGQYNSDVALFQGKEAARGDENNARMKDFEGANAEWAGKAGIDQAKYTADTLQSNATANGITGVVGSVAKAGIGLGMAGFYGGSTPGSSGSPIGADATMNAYNSSPKWFTQPGFEGVV